MPGIGALTHLDIEAKITRTGTGHGASIDISGITGDWTIVLEVYGVDASAGPLLFNFEDSADGFSSDIVPGPGFVYYNPGGTSALGGNSAQNSGTSSGSQGNDKAGHSDGYFANPKQFRLTKRDWNQGRFGVTSAHIRGGIFYFGGSGSVTYSMRVEY